MKKQFLLLLTINDRSRYLLLMLCGLTTTLWAQGAGSGEKWQITTSMQMSGMSMPSTSNEMCKAIGNDELPIQPEKNCQVYDAKRTGNTQSFKMRCTGKNAMEGSGEITYLSADHYRGAMKVMMGGDQMTMNYEGHKLGACDAVAAAAKNKKIGEDMQQQSAQLNAQLAEANRQMQQGQKDFCLKVTTEAESPSLMANCKEPQDLKTYCSNFQTYKPFQRQSAFQRKYSGVEQGNLPNSKPLDESSALCNVKIEPLRSKLCSTAEGDGKLGFLSQECPVQAAELVKKNCAGRKYTSDIDPKYQSFCARYASDSSSDDSGSESTDIKKELLEKPGSLVGKGKKALGSLFGH